MGKRPRILITLLATMVLHAALAAAPAVASSAEGSFVSKLNAERTARGLAPLEVYWDLKDDAEAHSQRMSVEDNLYHNSNLSAVTSGWQALGENVGVGASVPTLHDAFMASPGHRGNILGDFNYVGVGVVETDSKMWVTVVFMRGPDGLVSPPAEEPAAEEPPPAEEAPAEEPAPAVQPTPAPEETGPAADGSAEPKPAVTAPVPAPVVRESWSGLAPIAV